MPGFIKPVGGHTRMRFVQPGEDPDDYSTPPNKVIFDSDDLGTLSVVQVGEHTFHANNTGSTPFQLATWDLDFVPLCLFRFDIVGLGLFYQFLPIRGDLSDQKITVSQTGITIKATFTSGVQNLTVQYTAFRLATA